MPGNVCITVNTSRSSPELKAGIGEKQLRRVWASQQSGFDGDFARCRDCVVDCKICDKTGRDRDPGEPGNLWYGGKDFSSIIEKSKQVAFLEFI